MPLTPSQKARYLGLVMLGVVFIILVVFFVITWLTGDPTDHLEEHQPKPSPSGAAALAAGQGSVRAA